MMTNQDSIKALNSFLRGEISAVETYRQALEKMSDFSARQRLETARASHQQRVEQLRQRIMQLGGKPEEGSGAWGAFAKAVEGTAKAFGDKAAIAALEEGEDHGLADYRRDLDKLDPDNRRFVESELLPAQEQTHNALSQLKHTLH
jgi:uncharacterized protein (TIGR02284 family)